MSINHRFIAFIFLFLSGILIFWFGRLSVQYQLKKQVPPIEFVEEINPKIPLVEIMKLEGKILKGKINKSEIRITNGRTTAVPDQDNNFELKLDDENIVAEQKMPKVVDEGVPSWAKFVASKRGKYFYVIDEKSLKKLKKENHRYFSTEEAAMRAGYQKRTR